MHVPTDTGPKGLETATVAARLKALRDLRGLTQEQVADRSGGRLKRVDVTKIERGHSKGSSDRVRAGFAAALEVSREKLTDYLDGVIELPEAVAPPESPAATAVELDPRYPNKAKAVAAARALDLDPQAIEVVQSQDLQSNEDPPPLYWLDQIRMVADRLKWERRSPGEAAADRQRSQEHTDAMREQLRAKRGQK